MKFKRLIPAFAMLLIAAMLMGTSTFAWFSMNNRVTASTISITATSDLPYLVISETETGTYDTNAAAMVLDPVAATALKPVIPLNHDGDNLVSYYASAADRLASTTTTPAAAAANAAGVLWGTTTSSDPAEVQASNVTDLVAAADLDEYVQVSELWFKVLAADQPGANLECKSVTFNSNTNNIKTAARVLIVSESGNWQLFNFSNGATVSTASDDSGAALISSVTTTAQKVTVFFYFDGTESSVYTNNAANLDQAVTATFTFGID